jgi:enoyl-CoA hydratase
MSDEPVIKVDLPHTHTAVVTINRPKALNALNPEVINRLGEAIEKLEGEGIRHLVLTGAGGKAFVAGADIAAMKGLSREEAKAFARKGQRIIHRLTTFPGVTIAAVDGFALGGGMELAMACDLILCGDKSRFGQPEVNLGVIPGFGGTQRLGRLVGLQRARELIFTGRMVRADEAVRLGIALKAVEAGTALAAAMEIVDAIAAKGPQAIKWAKQAIALSDELDLPIGLQEEAELFALCFETEDQKEGMSAFLEKRVADFQGR